MNKPPHDLVTVDGDWKYALGYEDDLVLKLNQRGALREGAFVLPLLRRGMNLLDVGSGPGSISQGFAPLLSPGSVTGVDIDAGQVARAQASARRASLRNARFLTGSVYALPFAQEAFDIVFSHTVFMHLAQPQRALDELFRVCKTGGVIALREGLGSFDRLSAVPMNGVTRPFSEFMRQLTAVGSGQPDIGVGLKGMLHQAGFRRIESQIRSHVYDKPEDMLVLQSWFQSLLEGPLGQRALQAGLLTAEEMLSLTKSMARWTSDPAAISVVCWIEYTARKPEAQNE